MHSSKFAILCSTGRFFHQRGEVPRDSDTTTPIIHHRRESSSHSGGTPIPGKVPSALARVIQRMASHGYVVFRDDCKNYNLNLVGIRSDNRSSNTFNDAMWVFWKWQGIWNHRIYRITTDPGLTYLLTPMHSAGTAILKPGQYRQSFRLGKHKGVYDALVQSRPVSVIRDNNRDAVPDFHSGREETGFFGINIHRAAPQGESRYVNNWSAGCQVFANAVEFDEFIRVCKLARAEWGDGFTYTLLG